MVKAASPSCDGWVFRSRMRRLVAMRQRFPPFATSRGQYMLGGGRGARLRLRYKPVLVKALKALGRATWRRATLASSCRNTDGGLSSHWPGRRSQTPCADTAIRHR